MTSVYKNKILSVHSAGDSDCFLSASPDIASHRVSLSKGIELCDGKYVIECKIASGSFADVYLATDSHINRQVALKVFTGRCSTDMQDQHICKTEARLQDRVCSSDNVIKVHDFHATAYGATQLFLISTEYAEGGTFRKWLNQNKDNPEIRRGEGLFWFRQMCLGVDAVHKAGICHLDTKPENFVFAGDILKIIDFGTAAFVQELKNGRQTMENLLFIPATPMYMSPEHFAASFPNDLTIASDIYSLGIVLFEILHPDCRPPFSGSPKRLCHLHTNIGVDKSLLTQIDEDYRHIVQRCLARYPQDRYASVSDLLSDLESCLTESQDGEVVDKKEQQDSTDKDFQQARVLYGNIEEKLPQANLTELTELLLEAAELCPDHPGGKLIQARVSSEVSSFRQSVEDGIMALNCYDWDKAISCFQQSARTNRSTELPQQIIDIIRQFKTSVDRQRENIERAIENSEFDSAFEQAMLLEKFVNDNCLTKLNSF